MVILISSCSLLGVALLPLLNKDSKCHGLYKYIYFLMIALGTSALFCDAILHLLPEVCLIGERLSLSLSLSLSLCVVYTFHITQTEQLSSCTQCTSPREHYFKNVMGH